MGSDLEVEGRISSAHDFATQHGRELGRERTPQGLCDVILRIRVLTGDDFDVTKQGMTLSAESQQGR